MPELRKGVRVEKMWDCRKRPHLLQTGVYAGVPQEGNREGNWGAEMTAQVASVLRQKPVRGKKSKSMLDPNRVILFHPDDRLTDDRHYRRIVFTGLNNYDHAFTWDMLCHLPPLDGFAYSGEMMFDRMFILPEEVKKYLRECVENGYLNLDEDGVFTEGTKHKEYWLEMPEVRK
jgi:hypothetical protein